MKYSPGYLLELVAAITHKELKVRYKSSFLGYLWSLANPLLFAIIYFFVFKTIMNIQIPDYTLFLISGLFPWQWFANAVTNSPFSFLSNAQIIKKVAFPRSAVPVSSVLMELFHFLCALPVIVIFLFIYGKTPSWHWLWGIPLIGLAQMLLTLGIALACSTLNLFFRDMERFVALAVMLFFYMTPVLYAAEMIPEKYRWAIEYSPLAMMVSCWRELLINGDINYSLLINLYVCSMVVFILGVSVFNKLKYRFAEVL